MKIDIINRLQSCKQVDRLAIHQPNLFPRLKVLQKIVRSDLWVVLDDVQFATREWQNRVRLRFLKHPEQEFWLTIPVHRPKGQKSIIKSIRICNYNQSKNKIRKSLEHAYHRSEHWEWIEYYLNNIFHRSTNSLTDFCTYSTLECLVMLGLSRPVVFSSELNAEGKQTRKLVEICKKINASVYISGSGGCTYLDIQQFDKNDIELEWQFWKAPTIPGYESTFIGRDISFLDLVAHFGPDILRTHLLDWEERGERSAN